MKTSNRQQGQTLIETALILALILLIVVGITEFARAWFTKNSVKNAARTGARLAVVTAIATNQACPDPLVCDGSRSFTNCSAATTQAEQAYCNSPGIKIGESAVSVCYQNKPSDIGEPALEVLDKGDTINVCGRTVFTFVIGGNRGTIFGVTLWPWPGSMNFFTDASMSFE